MTDLEKFFNHELLIEITGISAEDLAELDNLLGLKFCNGSRLEKGSYRERRNIFLHCRSYDGVNKLSYSDRPVDHMRNELPMNYVTYSEILYDNKMQDVNLDDIFKVNENE